MKGDATDFAREDYVEEAWRIVDPILEARDSPGPVRSGNRGPERGGVRGSCLRAAGKTRLSSRGAVHVPSTG